MADASAACAENITTWESVILQSVVRNDRIVLGLDPYTLSQISNASGRQKGASNL
jgi:hypothetical protein